MVLLPLPLLSPLRNHADTYHTRNSRSRRRGRYGCSSCGVTDVLINIEAGNCGLALASGLHKVRCHRQCTTGHMEN